MASNRGKRAPSEQARLRALYAALVGRERAVFYCLKRGRDVPIRRLYESFEIAPRPQREMQMFVGSIVFRLNRKLRDLDYKIAPGARRGTYRLYDTRPA